MRKASLNVTVAIIACVVSAQATGAADEAVNALNNEGVKALNAGNMTVAIEKFKAALGLDPSFWVARQNLSIAHNNYGLNLRSLNKPEALKQFHAALFYNRGNKTTRDNLNDLIKSVGKDPTRFADRVALGEEAFKGGDFISAKVEYEAALAIKTDHEVQSKLKETESRLDPEDALLNAQEPPGQAETAKDVDFGPYMAALQRRIKRNYSYAGSSKRGPKVRFRLYKDGTCGLMVPFAPNSDSNGALMEAIRKSAPFAPLPEGAKDFYDIEFTMDYARFVER